LNREGAPKRKGDMFADLLFYRLHRRELKAGSTEKLAVTRRGNCQFFPC
jgi:hypothetical protein